MKMTNKDTLKERENILEKPDVLASTVIVRTDNVYEKYISEDKVRQIIEQTRKEEQNRIAFEFHNFRFSIPVGDENGKFTALYCPDCKQQRFACKECFINNIKYND